MKSAMSLAVIACLVTASVPMAAQDRAGAPASPVARTLTREAVRLAAAAESSASGIETVRQRGNRADWSRVLDIPPGAEIMVTVRRSSVPGKRVFVAAGDADLTVLNISNPALSSAARHVLRDIASLNPGYFPAAQLGQPFALEGNVRVAPDGVFVSDLKIADLAQVVERVTRADVAEIRGPAPYSVARNAKIGFATGALSALGLGLAVCRGTCGGDPGDLAAAAALMGSFLAGVSMAAGAAARPLHKFKHVIYRG